jgi:hypothetical protein
VVAAARLTDLLDGGEVAIPPRRSARRSPERSPRRSDTWAEDLAAAIGLVDLRRLVVIEQVADSAIASRATSTHRPTASAARLAKGGLHVMVAANALGRAGLRAFPRCQKSGYFPEIRVWAGAKMTRHWWLLVALAVVATGCTGSPVWLATSSPQEVAA